MEIKLWGNIEGISKNKKSFIPLESVVYSVLLVPASLIL